MRWMKTLGIVLLVFVLLLAGLPLAMGMGMDMAGDCPACTPDAPISLAMCLGVLSLFALALGLSSSKVSLASESDTPSVSLASLFRPPRTV